MPINSAHDLLTMAFVGLAMVVLFGIHRYPVQKRPQLVRPGYVSGTRNHLLARDVQIRVNSIFFDPAGLTSFTPAWIAKFFSNHRSNL